MSKKKRASHAGKSDGAADYWDLLLEDVPGSDEDYRVNVTFKGEDATGTFEIWLSAREVETPNGVANAWENGVRLPREQAAKLHAFLGAWLGALGP